MEVNDALTWYKFYKGGLSLMLLIGKDLLVSSFFTRTTTFEATQNEANLRDKHQRNSLTFWSDFLRELSRRFTLKKGGDFDLPKYKHSR